MGRLTLAVLILFLCLEDMRRDCVCGPAQGRCNLFFDAHATTVHLLHGAPLLKQAVLLVRWQLFCCGAARSIVGLAPPQLQA